ncbi:MAG: Gfo/Idh/MocA family oxidoreductase [Pseudomonadales bacterium]
MVIRFGTLGTARITPRALVYPCMDEPRAYIAAVAARDRGRAESFARWHGIPRVLDDYAAVVEDPDVEAVYVPLHIPAHQPWTLRALAAGKHVLCEKSFASNAAEAETMAAAARESGLVLMDAFHYRYHPIFHRARAIYESGELGEIRSIDAAFHIPVNDPHGIRMNYELGGGVTMDIGCYPISWVRHISGLEPLTVQAEAEEGPPHVDLMLKARMTLPGGVEATTSGDMRRNARFTAYLTVNGSQGSMHVVNPLVPQTGNRIEVRVGDERRVETFDRRPTYGYQLDAFLDAIEHGSNLLTGADDGVRQMRVIDRCYESAGLPLRGLDP